MAEIRQHLDTARQSGEEPPGRPTLAKKTGATEWQVRRALEVLEAEQAATAATPTADGTGITETVPAESADAAATPAADPAVSDADGGGLAGTGGVGTKVAPSPESSIDNGSEHSSAGGRLVAWAGFLFGAMVSIAANVLAARIPPEHAPAGWEPSMVAEVFAAVWPLALLLSVEALSRVRWPAGPMWNMARYGGAGTVALGSAVISYGHINEVLTFWGYTVIGAGVGPLVIDGLMTICGFAMLAGSIASRRQRAAGQAAADAPTA
ncbi:hypothetical protein [Kutzneria chonburiensis]|uniref:hypothetical protein n=1 Tax=Kutzneria chonburiensis TaxID=1483604 RepID=UPI00235DC44F|nr:hypothetical protein [Kutzneria chonburiensis]